VYKMIVCNAWGIQIVELILQKNCSALYRVYKL
jgi:hypothetical protein